jgi:hypothetical protein
VLDDRLVPEREDLFAYYAGQDEGQRLFRYAHNGLELLRTRELLLRQLPSPQAVVLDVGGGTAAWLAARGYRVHLVDVVVEHVRAAAEQGLVTAEVGDARRRTQAAASVDAVLLLGRSTTSWAELTGSRRSPRRGESCGADVRVLGIEGAWRGLGGLERVLDGGLLGGVLALLVLQAEVEACAPDDGQANDGPADYGEGDGLAVGLSGQVKCSDRNSVHGVLRH